MYRSPIDILVSDIQHQIAEQQDEQIYKAVVSVGINVDKDELVRALAYDRHQYMKGYADGEADATPKWISVKDGLPDLHTAVLTYDRESKMDLFWYDENGFNVVDEYGCTYPVKTVTHWMPLPKPPAESTVTVEDECNDEDWGC